MFCSDSCDRLQRSSVAYCFPDAHKNQKEAPPADSMAKA
jgi:hypothetical protein